MVLEPVGQRVGRTVGKQINRLMALKIDQDSAKHLAFAQGKVIHSYHPWCGDARWLATSQAK
jgi:hypothetical protein